MEKVKTTAPPVGTRLAVANGSSWPWPRKRERTYYIREGGKDMTQNHYLLKNAARILAEEAVSSRLHDLRGPRAGASSSHRQQARFHDGGHRAAGPTLRGRTGRQAGKGKFSPRQRRLT